MMRAESMPEPVEEVNKVPIEVSARAASGCIDVSGAREVGSRQIAVRWPTAIGSMIGSRA